MHSGMGEGVKIRRKISVLEKRMQYLIEQQPNIVPGSGRDHRTRAEIAALRFAVATIREAHAKFFAQASIQKEVQNNA